MTPSTSPDLDLVLVGATGFVGRIAAAHLAATAPPGLRVGLAGRSLQRLEEVRSASGEVAARWPLVVLDVTDPAAVRSLAERSGTVASTVGPYAVFGMPLARACAEAGTDYADLTGEVRFVHQTVHELHERAVASGARLVHACGFDSVPSDLAVWLTAQAAAADGQGGLADTTLHVRRLRGGVSGGTVDSLRQERIAARRDPSLNRALGDPLALVGESDRAGAPGPPPRHGGRRRLVKRVDGTWTAPFVMASFNSRLVRRSAALLGYGPDLRYREVLDTGRGPTGALRATGVTAALAVVAGALSSPLTRPLADRLLPAPGEGPSQRRRAAGSFAMEVVARTTTGARYATVCSVDLDPGYDAAAVMLGQTALALALGESTSGGGVLTPAAAVAAPLVARLRDQGFTLQTRRLPDGRSA